MINQVLPVGVSITERAAFKLCRRQHDYAYRQHLVPNEVRPSAMWIGRLVHFALAEYYSGRDWHTGFDSWIDRHSASGGDEGLDPETIAAMSLAEALIQTYVEYAQANDTWEVLEVEPSWTISVPGARAPLECHPDLVVREAGRLWIVDHKTCASFKQPAELQWDDQMTGYLYAAWRRYGEMPAGAIYNQIRKSIPRRPMLLKSGDRLSVDKSIDTTYDIYLAAILEHGFDPANYTALLENLKKNRFICREVIPHNSIELQNFEVQCGQEIEDIRSELTFRYPNKTHDCAWRCSFKGLCQAQDEGGDVPALIDFNFHARIGRDS